MSNRDQTLKITVGLTLFIYTFSVFFPGSYSNDTWAQYNHAINEYFGDWFDPGLSYLWYTLIHLTGSFISLYVLQMALFLLFITMLTWDLNIKSLKFWLATALSTFFVVIAQYIMRDSLMAILWGLAVVLLFRSENFSNKSRYRFVLIAFLLCFGLWIRSNCVIALFPLIAAFVRVSVYPKKINWKISLTLCLLLPFLILTGLRFVNYSILKTNNEFPAYKLKMCDIAGISILSGENLFPALIKTYPKFDIEKLKTVYSPASFDHIYWPNDRKYDLVPFPDQKLNEEVAKSWVNAIKKHPLYYLKNRMSGYLYYLRIKKRFEKEDYWNVPIFIDSDNPLHVATLANPVREGFNIMYHKFNKTIFYEPWFWLVLNCIGFVLFAIRNKAFPSLFLEINLYVQLSGILYLLSQFFVYQFDRDFRYNYWNVFVTLIAICSLLNKSGWTFSFKKSHPDL